MADDRPVADIVDEQRKAALEARLRYPDKAGVKDYAGVGIITARDIQEVFESEYEADYSHKFEATTPALGRVDLVCLNCHQTIPDVAVALGAVTTIEKEGVSRVRVKATANVRNHVCGQISVPRVPQPPEVEGQVGMDETVDEDAEADAIERLQAAPSVLDDDDLLPGEAVDKGEGDE